MLLSSAPVGNSVTFPGRSYEDPGINSLGATCIPFWERPPLGLWMNLRSCPLISAFLYYRGWKAKSRPAGTASVKLALCICPSLLLVSVCKTIDWKSKTCLSKAPSELGFWMQTRVLPVTRTYRTFVRQRQIRDYSPAALGCFPETRTPFPLASSPAMPLFSCFGVIKKNLQQEALARLHN